MCLSTLACKSATRVYFDTNVYRFVGAVGEVSLMRELLDASECTLVASSGNLFETFAIQSERERHAEIDVLVRLARRFTRKPSSWLHALEMRNEIRLRRPAWTRRLLSSREEKQIRALLRGHSQNWEEARSGQLPPADAYSMYRRDVEAGTATQKHFQKTVRGLRSRNKADFSIVTPHGQIDFDPADPEVFWRIEGLQVWYNAIEGRDPSSRDYHDWLAPFLKPGSFKDPSYESLWLQELSAAAMPLNRLVGLVSFCQLEHKVSHGNAADQLHAGHWLREDLFFTADTAFHQVLKKVADVHFPQKPKPVLLDRGAPSCVKQVEAILKQEQV